MIRLRWMNGLEHNYRLSYELVEQKKYRDIFSCFSWWQLKGYYSLTGATTLKWPLLLPVDCRHLQRSHLALSKTDTCRPPKPDARHVQGALTCYCTGPASQTVDQHKTSSGAFNNAPSKHATSTQSRVNVRRTTKTVGQHWVEVTCFLEMWGFQLKHFKPHFTPRLFSLLNI